MKEPPVGKYVVVHYCGGNWVDDSDQYGCEWVVAKLRRYHDWDTFGALKLRSCDVDRWIPLPEKHS